MQQKTVDNFIIFAKATFNISLYCYKNVSMWNFEMLAMQNAYIQKNGKKRGKCGHSCLWKQNTY